MRVTVTQIRALGLDWPEEHTGPDGMVDLSTTIEGVDDAYDSAEREYFASLGKPDEADKQARYFGLRELGDHAFAVRALVLAIGERSINVGPIPRAMIDTLGLPCSALLSSKLVAVDDELDLVKTMELLVRNYRYYQREHAGLSAMARKWNAPRSEISDRWGELSAGMSDNQAAIAELSAILAAVCR